MADVYVDLDKSASTEDGTSWANAYRLPSEISVSSGDDVWIQGNTNAHSGSTLALTLGTDDTNPVKIHGCKQGTTAEPPATSDLIPGWRTGEARTVANRAYKDGDVPLIRVSDGNSYDVSGHFYMYGIKLQGGGNVRLSRTSGDNQIFEECLVEMDGGTDFYFSLQVTSATRFLNGGFETNATGAEALLLGYLEIIGLEYIGTTAATGGLFRPTSGGYSFLTGCDLSGLGSNAIFDVAGVHGNFITLAQSELASSFTVSTGTKTGEQFVDLVQCTADSGKSSGTIVNYDGLRNPGDIVEETTAVRTGGASDGSSSWSFALTPIVNGTRDQYYGLYGPWLAFKITGDGTAQTVTVYIANSGATDYNDDDVWLEVMYPSESGTAQYDNQTTQMDLLGTPTAVTDDTGSTWGTGGNNPQKLTASISPDYIGDAYCRVVFAKNFPSSPETLYVDPLPAVS